MEGVVVFMMIQGSWVCFVFSLGCGFLIGLWVQRCLGAGC